MGTRFYEAEEMAMRVSTQPRTTSTWWYVGVFIVTGIVSVFMMGCGPSHPDLADQIELQESREIKMEDNHSMPKLSDNAQIFQLVIDIPEMNGFYHVDQLPDRTPLKILRSDLALPEFNLVKFGVPVEYVSSTEVAEGIPIFEFTSIEITEDSAEVEFRYLVEGVKGTVTLVKSDSHWEVSDKSIVEQ